MTDARDGGTVGAGAASGTGDGGGGVRTEPAGDAAAGAAPAAPGGPGAGDGARRVGAYAPPGDARPAASLLLLRDGADGLEVLMLRRAERAGDLRGGAAVFPGGVVDAGDRAAHGAVDGLDDAAASARLGVAAGGLDYWVAAVRETLEEVGLVVGAAASPASADARRWRDALNRGAVGMAEVCAATGWRIDAGAFVYFSHWLTPPGVPKRFDTRFFAVAAPPGQTAVPDYAEAVESMWLTPAAALDPARGLTLLPVTRHTLLELARSATAAAALAAARARAAVRLTMPRRAQAGGALRIVLPHEPAYAEVARLDPDGRGDAASDLVAGRAVRLSDRVVRLTAPNPGLMTGPGTNSYLVAAVGAAGSRRWTVIDPGPADAAHVAALQAAAAPGVIDRVVVTHTHRDHSPGAALLVAATGATTAGRVAVHAAGHDTGFAPDRTLEHGDRLALGDGCTLVVHHTPGHASNHLCFELVEEALLFTGDHVMQGSTVVVNPPDGDMGAYLASLRVLRGRGLRWLAPGHGFLIGDPDAAIDALLAHRLRREARVLDALPAAPAPPQTPADLVARVYADVPADRHGLAARSLLAHLLELERDGRAVGDGAGRWSLAPPRGG